jgi:mannose-6-phosphate isomerase
VERLIGTIQNYAWGSHTMLSSLRGEESSELPEAEIWYGAHPVAPSKFNDGSTLLAAIEADATALVGEGNVDRFGTRLPFLLKLLAADKPLSIQAHPTIEQAREGFAREDEAGVAVDAPNRSFRDNNHKPELIAAITPFEALVGFREPTRTVDFLRGLEAPGSIISCVSEEGPKAAMQWLLEPQSAHQDDVTTCIAAIVAGAKTYTGNVWAAEADLVTRLNSMYPNNPGVGIAALLNRIVLEPGEAAFLDTGNLHAYVSGLGVEIMANCDNVVRGGLTPKHIDVPSLLTIVRSDSLDAKPVALDNDRYLSPAPEFALTRVDPDVVRTVAGPAIVLAVEGTTTALTEETLMLEPTQAAWVPFGESVSVSSTELAFIAEVGSTMAVPST